MNAHKKSPAIPAPGQAPQEGTRMNQQNTISNFTPAQTPQACEIQKTALWVAGHIGTGMNAEDMILVRDTLLSLAGQVESVELLLIETLCEVPEQAAPAGTDAGVNMSAEPEKKIQINVAPLPAGVEIKVDPIRVNPSMPFLGANHE